MHAALRSCATPKCPTLVVSGHCRLHARVQEQQRGSSRARGYTRRWDAASKVFRALYPLCGMRPNGVAPVMSRCHEEGRSIPAEQTDHVIPHKGDEVLFWDSEHNWQSLCASCGARKSQAGL